MSAMRAMAGASLVVALLALVGLARANTLLPGDPVPSFSVETLSGGEFCIVEGPQESPAVVYAFNTADGFSYAMFEDASVKRFLDTGPAGARYLFTCSDCVTNNEAKFVAKFMSDAIEGGLARGEGSRDAWRDRIHFASRALASDGVLAGVLKGWNSTVSTLSARSTSPGGESFDSILRVDGHFGYLPHLPNGTVLAAELAPNNLCDAWAGKVTNNATALLIPWTSGRCTFSTVLANAQSSGAAAAVLYPDPPSPLVEISCSGSECDVPISIPATMMDGRGGALIAESLRSAASSLKFVFSEEASWGRSLSIDSAGNLREVGWPVWPWLSSLAWAAQYLNYESRLPAAGLGTVVPIFKGDQPLDGDIVATVDIDKADLARSPKISLDMTLECTGNFDSDCPAWDHVLMVFVTCGEPDPEPCLQLIWSDLNASAAFGGPTGESCGPEIGRWMTPFRRRGGRWVTDVTDLKGAFLGPQGDPTARTPDHSCTFRMRSVTWANTGSDFWLPKLSLRVAAPSARQEEPTSHLLVPLFGSRTFDQHYNDRMPRRFQSPQGLVSAKIRALITGHGSDENQCAEFCPGIANYFFINGKQFELEFPRAGTQLGCTFAVSNGSLPNEHGTWFYGRNGWCDGQAVEPWVIDITEHLAPSDWGYLNVLEFAGLYNGKTPNPTSNPGQMLVSSHLIFEVSLNASSAPTVS